MPNATKRYAVLPDRRHHILFGDPSSGGHKHGYGRGKKGEFPATWSDDDIIQAVESVANDPTSTSIPIRWGCFKLIGMRNSFSVTVVVDPAIDYVKTAYPT